MYRPPSISSLSISLLALLAAASCSDKDANDTSVPVAYRGQNVRSMETDISEGKRATFYFSDKGFLPASTKRVEMLNAGPEYEWTDGDGSLAYRWTFKMKFAEDASPTSIIVENVTDRKAAEVLLPKQDIQRSVKLVQKDGKIYGVADAEWGARSELKCRVARDEPCSAWLYETNPSPSMFYPGPVFVGLRIRIGYADDSTETLYQGLSFDPEKELKRVEAQMAGDKD